MTDYLLHSIVWHCKIEKCKLMLNKTTVLIRTTNHQFRTKNIFENSKVFLVPCLHCTENHIFFFQTSWKVGLSKKITLEHDLSRIIGKDHVSLSRKHDLNLRQKMKDDLFQKNTRKYDILFGPPEKKVFSKRAAPGHDLYVLSGKMVFFFSKTRYFFLGQESRDDPSQEIHGNIIFSVYTGGCYKPGVMPHCQKKIKNDLIPQR